MKRIVLIIIALIGVSHSYAQEAPATVYPETGKPCPDFVLRNITYYPKKQAALKDFQGKWLVLDFWNKGCGACVASFPKTNALQKKFGDQVQFMLVGIEDKEHQIRPMYAKFREKEHLVLPCAFDSLLANRFDIYTAPFIIVIDPGGIVRAVTASINEYQMEGFLRGHAPRLKKTFRMHEPETDPEIPFDDKKLYLVNGNGGTDTAFLFRSVLTGWDPNLQAQSFADSIGSGAVKSGKFQVLGVPLYWLYNYAYYGLNRPGDGYLMKPELHIKDSTAFDSTSSDGRNCYGYSLCVPVAKASKMKMQEMMQRDLKNYFGYEVSQEVRKVPSWRLVSTEEAKRKLKSTGGATSVKMIPKVSFNAHNFPFNKLISVIQLYSGVEFIDETGIDGNVDMAMDLLFQGNAEELKKAFSRYGLELVKGEKEVKVLVIREGKE